MARPYNALRRAMHERSVTQVDIAKAFKCTPKTVSNKMRNVTPWTLDEIWTLMNMMALDPRRMAVYFPYYGRNE